MIRGNVMTELILTFCSSQDAIAGERKLLDAGVDVQAIPVPRAMGRIVGKTVDPGCNVCLLVSSADLDRARLLLGGSIRDICPKNDTASGDWQS